MPVLRQVPPRAAPARGVHPLGPESQLSAPLRLPAELTYRRDRVAERDELVLWEPRREEDRAKVIPVLNAQTT